jgi:D-lactate dehydrogenase
MKIIMFSTREDENDVAINWSKNRKVEVKNISEPLSLENISLVQGFDGIVTCQTKKLETEIYKQLKDNGIKQIASRTAGIDMFDMKEATKHGISITNVPVYSPNAIAEYAVTASLNIVRHVNQIQESMKKQDYRWQKHHISKEIRTMTIAIIGTGRIGRITAQIFKGFGAKVIGYDLYPCEEAREYIDYVDTMEEAVEQGDLISLHMPATNDNFHLFNREMFNRMKGDVFFVNTARGTIVDTKALLEALDNGKIAAAALDTYENEFDYYTKDFSGKQIDDAILKELIARDDVLITPHTAFYTETAVLNLVEGGLNGAYDVIETGTSKYKVN